MTELSYQHHSALLARVRTALAGTPIADPGLRADLQQAEQWLDAHPRPLPVDVHVGFIDHKCGGNHYAAFSREDLMAEIAQFCREWWSDIRDKRDPATLDDEQIAEIYFARHEEEYLWTERISVAAAVPELVSPLRIRRHLVLSTSHIRPSTADLLDQWAPMLPEARPLGVAEAGYGWFVLTDPLDGEALEMVPPELRAAIDFARAQGCRWLLLDRDADCVDELQTFGW